MNNPNPLLINRLRMALAAADLNLTEYEAALIVTMYEAVKQHGEKLTIDTIERIQNEVQKNVKN